VRIIKSIAHYSHAIASRCELWREISRAETTGTSLPKGVRRQIGRNPSSLDIFIHLLRFVRPGEPLQLLDVGGNVGLWAENFLSFFPQTVVSGFEPVQATWESYRRRFHARPTVTCHQFALSNRSGDATIMVDRTSVHSTIETPGERLDPLGLAFERKETVALARLDDFPGLIDRTKKIILKVDVQGHEVEMIEGSVRTLPAIAVAVVECSFASYYEDKLPSFSRVASALLEAGLYPVIFRDYGRMLGPHAWERDVIFVRRDLLQGIFGD
jgi:FkbM family methyltransferase